MCYRNIEIYSVSSDASDRQRVINYYDCSYGPALISDTMDPNEDVEKYQYNL